MTHEEILKKALKKACQYMVKYPPAEMPFDEEYKDIIPLMCGIATEEKGYLKYMQYFVIKVMMEDGELD